MPQLDFNSDHYVSLYKPIDDEVKLAINILGTDVIEI